MIYLHGCVTPAKIPRNGQPEKKIWVILPGQNDQVLQINQKVSLWKESQVLQSLGDPFPERLAGVVTKYWQYKPETFSVIRCLNQKFLIS